MLRPGQAESTTGGAPVDGVISDGGLVQVRAVLHDLRHALQDGEGLHDPHRQRHQAGDVHPDVVTV